jgi:N-methylhydantoinase B
MFGASEKYRKRATAVWHGSHAHITTHGFDSSGNYFVSPLTDTFGGAAGARAFKDGVDIGGEIPNVVSRWGNAETHEEMLPLIYVYRRIVKDSGGPGKYRGGVCHEYAITPQGSMSHSLSVVLYGKGVRAPHSTGIFGGYPGCNVDYIIFRESLDWEKGSFPIDLASSSGKKVEHVQWGVFDLQDGDLLYIRFMGGGGYGDPVDRDPELVLQDVLRGLVSRGCAANIYGVVINEDKQEVDIGKTKKKRISIRQKRLEPKNLNVSGWKKDIQDSDCPISEYLQLMEANGRRFVQCKWCGEAICKEGQNWKDNVPKKEFPVSKAGPFRARGDQFLLQEFYCASCATLLDIEVLFKGDSHLNDEIFW